MNPKVDKFLVQDLWCMEFDKLILVFVFFELDCSLTNAQLTAHQAGISTEVHVEEVEGGNLGSVKCLFTARHASYKSKQIKRRKVDSRTA
jgi:hypothetical protein